MTRINRLRRQRGVTLMELLISLVVIVVGMLVIFRVLSTGVQGGQASSRMAQAQQRAESIIEAIRLAPTAAVLCLETNTTSSWANCETTCRTNQTNQTNPSVLYSSCIFTTDSFSYVKGPLIVSDNTQNQAEDRQGQKYFLVGGGALMTATSYGKTYVRMGPDFNRTAEIGVTIGWNDDNTTNTTPVAGVNYPQHSLTFITAMPQPAGP